jgi:hypothetical protein
VNIPQIIEIIWTIDFEWEPEASGGHDFPTIQSLTPGSSANPPTPPRTDGAPAERELCAA